MPKHHRKQSNVHNKRSSRWVTKIEKGTNGGGLNGGINIVADRETGKAYVEKVFPAEGISNGYAKREIDVMMQLRGHSSIIYIEDYFIDYHKRRGSVVMEYCTMGSLDKLISRHRNANMRPIGEHYIWKWFIQIASALQYCHYGPYPRDPREVAKWNPVFHRDLKPANVFLSRNKKGPQRGEVVAKLADFGCASTKTLMASRQSSSVKQSAFTLAFSPPELPRFDRSSDIWQLGATMICLCNLKLTPAGYDAARPSGYTNNRNNYSDLLDQAISGCMYVDQRRRFNSWSLLNFLQESYSKVGKTIGPDIELILPTNARS